MQIKFSEMPEFADWFQDTFGIECGIMETPNDVFHGVPVSAMTRYVDAYISLDAIEGLRRIHGFDNKKIVVEVLKLSLQAEGGAPFKGIIGVYAYQSEMVAVGKTEFRIKFRYGVINESDRGGMEDTLS